MCEQHEKTNDRPLRDIIADEMIRARISVEEIYRGMGRLGSVKSDSDVTSTEAEKAKIEPALAA